MTDYSELNTLVHDLGGAGPLAGVRVLAVVEESAQQIEDQAKEWAPRKRLPHYARTITHDVAIEPGVIAAEIGPDRDINGQAKLAPIFEYGTADLAPRAHLGPALDLKSPGFAAAVDEVGERVL